MKFHAALFAPVAVVCSMVVSASALTATAAAAAQEAAVSGRVVDTSGGAVPGATVVLTNLATSATTETVTNASGLFSFPSTRPGVYTIAVSLAGFANSRVEDVRIETGGQRDVTIELKPAGLEESVLVEGAQATPLVTTRADRSLVVEPEFVTSIPLNIRNPLLMINSAVGVTPALATTGNNSASQSATNTFQINGTKATTSDQQIDGAANLVSYLNQVAAIPQVDAVEEFRVVTSAYAPEHGRTSGAVVSVRDQVGHEPAARIGDRVLPRRSVRREQLRRQPRGTEEGRSRAQSVRVHGRRTAAAALAQAGPHVLLRRLRGAAPAAGRARSSRRCRRRSNGRATFRRRATPTAT